MEVDIQKLIQMYEEGLSLRKIEGRTGIPRETVRRILHTHSVEMRHRPITYHKPREQLDEDVALLLGLHVGDGWLSREWGISCDRNERSMVGRIIELVRDVLGVQPIVGEYKKNEATVRSGQHQVREFFLNYGLPLGRKAEKIRVPKRVLELDNPAVIKAFLCGLFSADRCFSFQKGRSPRVEIQVKSKMLRDDFVGLAGLLGFSFRLYEYLPSRGKNKAPLQVAYTTQSSQCVRWMEEVGSIKDSHIKRYGRWKKIIETVG